MCVLLLTSAVGVHRSTLRYLGSPVRRNVSMVDIIGIPRAVNAYLLLCDIFITMQCKIQTTHDCSGKTLITVCYRMTYSSNLNADWSRMGMQ